MGVDTVFNGSLSFEGTVRIDGKFEGRVEAEDTLIVGETGNLTAEIIAGSVICQGKIKGTIIAKKKIEMHASSQITGNIQSPALHMELGAVLNGNCDMSGNNEPKIIKLVKNEEKEAASL